MKNRPGIFGRLGRYLIEIIIIIIGISLSFALNDWDKKRSQEKEYHTYLLNLQQDIRIDSAQIVNDMKGYNRIIDGIDLILRYDDKHRQDSLPYLANAVSNLLNNIEFLPNNNTFEVLRSTGGFKVFKNEKLVKQIVTHYQFDYAYINMMLKGVIHERNNLLQPFMIKNIYFKDQVTFPEIKTDVPKLVSDPVFWNICYSYQGSCYSVLNAYDRTLKRANLINDLIKQELEVFKK